jgi:hypothetical protein
MIAGDIFTVSELDYGVIKLISLGVYSQYGLKAIDTTVEKTNIWLKEMMEVLVQTDRHRGF